MEIAARIRNLLFADKLVTAAQHRGDTVRPVLPGPLGAPDLLVVDLSEPDWEAAVSEAVASRIPVLAFGPHVRSDLFAAARQQGVAHAVANSKFAESLPELLAKVLD